MGLGHNSRWALVAQSRGAPRTRASSLPTRASRIACRRPTEGARLVLRAGQPIQSEVPAPPERARRTLGGRSTVGHGALDAVIGVRIPASQPAFARLEVSELRLAGKAGQFTTSLCTQGCLASTQLRRRTSTALSLAREIPLHFLVFDRGFRRTSRPTRSRTLVHSRNDRSAGSRSVADRRLPALEIGTETARSSPLTMNSGRSLVKSASWQPPGSRILIVDPVSSGYNRGSEADGSGTLT